ncbi:MAG: hypothetical protein JO107_12415 [Hyphomicrobiales bacterium]|nr:hypothetical protein [Hyphomicrobiales bacterium]MBV8663896.1 hypothetical protein [Hyphomicrobiales bacterium]
MFQGPENPGLDELLADPLVQATMRADGVESQAVKSLMKTVARRLAARGRESGPAEPMRVVKAASLSRDALPAPFVRGVLPFAGGGAIGAGECCFGCR